jgi:hypothetical protein
LTKLRSILDGTDGGGVEQPLMGDRMEALWTAAVVSKVGRRATDFNDSELIALLE